MRRTYVYVRAGAASSGDARDDGEDGEQGEGVGAEDAGAVAEQEPEGAAGGVVGGARGRGEGAVCGAGRVAEPPALQRAAGGGGDGVRVRHLRPAGAPLRRRAVSGGAAGGGGGGAPVLASVQLRRRPRGRRMLPPQPGPTREPDGFKSALIF